MIRSNPVLVVAVPATAGRGNPAPHLAVAHLESTRNSYLKAGTEPRHDVSLVYSSLLTT